jgi:catechol 2,3-dioxygenase-like lactoylglutathione lyase family enzyme
MVRVVGIDHLVISVGDFEKSKSFYAPLMKFLGFDVEAEYEGSMMGWANGNTLFWIAAADAEGKKHTYRKGEYRLSPLRLPFAEPRRCRCATGLFGRAGRDHRRSSRRILRRLLRGFLSRPRRHEA